MIDRSPPPKGRKSLRMKDFDYTMAVRWFVTVCTYERQCILSEIIEGYESMKVRLSDMGQTVEHCWKEIPNHFPQVILDEYVIMPNHIHGILEITGDEPIHELENDSRSPMNCRGVACYAPTGTVERFSGISPQPQSLGAIIRSFKSAATKHARIITGQSDLKLWQRSYFEHGIRTDKSLDRIRDYIRNNPALWNEDEENPERFSDTSPSHWKSV